MLLPFRIDKESKEFKMKNVVINGTTIDVSDDLYNEIVSKQKKQEPIKSLSDMIGRNYFIRTETFHFTGKIKAIIGYFFVLDSCAWIADSGRFSDALEKGNLDEIEPMGDGVLVNIQSVTDMTPWKHALPTTQK